METSIELKKMRFHSYHGVMEQERKVGNDFEVSLAITYPMAQAMATDDIADAINYAEVYELVACEMGKPSRLLENVASRIINALRSTFPAVTGGEISVTKLTPPFKCEMQGVSVHVRF